MIEEGQFPGTDCVFSQAMVETAMFLRLQPMSEASARALADWRYDAPYDVYNLKVEERDRGVRYFCDPHNAFYSFMDEPGNLLGFCSFGPDGQVAGGDYHQEALDIGLGLRPDLTGQGQGRRYAEAALDFGRRTFAPRRFRVTIAEFNQHAQRAWRKLGFCPTQRFQRPPDGAPFLIFVREA